MAKPSEKLASSLELLKRIQDQGFVAIRSVQLSRVHRERLIKEGFLQEVMKGWYIPARPEEMRGENTGWYTAFWSFCAEYLNKRFKSRWSLSPEDSVRLHSGNSTIVPQLLVRSPKARNQITKLIHRTSLLEMRAAMPNKSDVFIDQNGLRLFSLPVALINCAEDFYRRNPTEARTALLSIRDASELLKPLLENGHSTIAGRLAGAFRNIGRKQIADDILNGMRTAGYDVREKDPFEASGPMLISSRERSPYVNRIQLMWESMREPIIRVFPTSPGLPKSIDSYLKKVADIYVLDAYNSLSIEGYRVSPEIIDQVRSGKWRPDDNENDRNHVNAMAARGYWQAYQAVQNSIQTILKGTNPGKVAGRDHSTWYREMFGASVTAGILKPADLAGYRNSPVFIRRSMHVPLNAAAVHDAMPAFFELLTHEKEPAVRVVLGHFIFVYIHPYPDGNGRIGRFLMNAMLASGGYPWTIIPLAEREKYMSTLESASVEQNIKPFAQFLASLINRAKKRKG